MFSKSEETSVIKANVAKDNPTLLSAPMVLPRAAPVADFNASALSASLLST